MNVTDWTVRWAVYQHFIATGRAGEVGDLAKLAGVDAEAIPAALARLHEAHHLVLGNGKGLVRMASPFSAVPTAFPVEAGGRTYWANCVWDALGIPMILGQDSRTATDCPQTGERLEFGWRNGEVWGRGIVHFLVPARHFYDDLGFT